MFKWMQKNPKYLFKKNAKKDIFKLQNIQDIVLQKMYILFAFVIQRWQIYTPA